MPIEINPSDISMVVTVSDLQTYLTTFPSPIAAQFVQDAISFFLTPCNCENRKERKEAIRERRQMGLSRKLEQSDKLTKEVCVALINHIAHPRYGRKNADDTAYLVAASFGDSNPVLTAFGLLQKLPQP